MGVWNLRSLKKPIAVASVGPLPGIILLCVVGLTMLLTLTALTEAFTRSGPVRYGDAYFGRLVADYLGKAAFFIPTAAPASSFPASMPLQKSTRWRTR